MFPRLLEWAWQNKGKLAIPVVAMLAFAAGRFTVPERVQNVDREVTLDAQVVHEVREVAKVETSAKKTARAVDRVRVTLPDGTRVVSTKLREVFDAVASQQTEIVQAKQTERVFLQDERHTKTVERSAPDWRVGGLVGVTLQPALRPVYGLHVERRILGPVSLGAWGLSSGVIGASLSAEF